MSIEPDPHGLSPNMDDPPEDNMDIDDGSNARAIFFHGLVQRYVSERLNVADYIAACAPEHKADNYDYEIRRDNLLYIQTVHSDLAARKKQTTRDETNLWLRS